MINQNKLSQPGFFAKKQFLNLILTLVTFFQIGFIQAQPVVESTATNTGTHSQATVNKPSGVVNGDLLVIGLMYEKGSAETITKPSGWTLIERTDNSTDNGLATFYKVAGSNEPASYQFGLSNGSKWSIGITRISNVDASNPIDTFKGATGSNEEDLSLCENPHNMDFEKDDNDQAISAGQIIDDEWSDLGIHITTFSPSNHPAMIFNSANITGGDKDLGSPNKDFGGPGVGYGGRSGHAGENNFSLGNILIISEDGDVNDPDDDAGGGTISITYDEPVWIESIELLDIDENNNTITAYDANGNTIDIISMPNLGNNSYQNVDIFADDVSRLDFHFNGSGAIASILSCGGSDDNDRNIVKAPSVTTSEDNNLVLCFYTNNQAATFTPDGSINEEYDAPNTSAGQPSNMMASFVQTTAGATGDKDAYASQNEKWAGQQISITAALASLPVELVSFSGIAMDRSNMLKWQTASEKNTMMFIVERSLNGKTKFEEINRVNAVGNSTTLRSYETEDLDPVALAYYRLRIIDFDGTFEFSDIIAVERNKTKIDLVEVFPIPAEEEVTVLVYTKTSGRAIMTLSDFMGRKIKEDKIEMISGINRYTLNWEEHETNFFYLTIYNGKERIVKKILRASRD